MANYSEELKNFQIQIGYKFKNISLLKYALTHSKDGFCGMGRSVKSKCFKNLGTVGDAVLKLITSEYAIRQHHELKERAVSEHRVYLNGYEAEHTRLAKQLFIDNGKCAINEIGVIRISEGILKNPNFGEVPYHKFFKALFGAVFLDGGGSAGNGIRKCRHVFRTIWDFSEILPKLRSCFPVDESIQEYWRRMGIDELYVENASLGLQFENPDLLCEAFIHESFYDSLESQEDVAKIHKPDYQRLAFLGESVFKLIIAEHMFQKYPNGESSIVELVDSHIDSRRWSQSAVEWVSNLVKKDEKTVFHEFDKFLRAFIGAAYVDCGADDTNGFVLSMLKLTEPAVWKPETYVAEFESWENEDRSYIIRVSCVLFLTYLAISTLKSKS